MKKLLIILLLVTGSLMAKPEKTYKTFQAVDGIMLSVFAGTVYYGYQEGYQHKTFFHRVRYGLELDGFHVVHLAEGLVYGWIRGQDAVRDWLWWNGFPEWFAAPSDNLLLVENFLKDIAWEGLELWLEPEKYSDVYGSKKKAIKNNVLDVIVSCLGCYATTDLPWIKNLLPNFAIVPIRIEDGILINMTMEI